VKNILYYVKFYKESLKCSVIKAGKINQYKLSIWKESMPLLSKLVSPYIIDEMKYKFTGYM
jgi:hypothetical protein